MKNEKYNKVKKRKPKKGKHNKRACSSNTKTSYGICGTGVNGAEIGGARHASVHDTKKKLTAQRLLQDF